MRPIHPAPRAIALSLSLALGLPSSAGASPELSRRALRVQAGLESRSESSLNAVLLEGTPAGLEEGEDLIRAIAAKPEITRGDILQLNIRLRNWIPGEELHYSRGEERLADLVKWINAKGEDRARWELYLFLDSWIVEFTEDWNLNLEDPIIRAALAHWLLTSALTPFVSHNHRTGWALMNVLLLRDGVRPDPIRWQPKWENDYKAALNPIGHLDPRPFIEFVKERLITAWPSISSEQQPLAGLEEMEIFDWKVFGPLLSDQDKEKLRQLVAPLPPDLARKMAEDIQNAYQYFWSTAPKGPHSPRAPEEMVRWLLDISQEEERPLRQLFIEMDTQQLAFRWELVEASLLPEEERAGHLNKTLERLIAEREKGENRLQLREVSVERKGVVRYSLDSFVEDPHPQFEIVASFADDLVVELKKRGLDVWSLVFSTGIVTDLRWAVRREESWEPLDYRIVAKFRDGERKILLEELPIEYLHPGSPIRPLLLQLVGAKIFGTEFVALPPPVQREGKLQAFLEAAIGRKRQFDLEADLIHTARIQSVREGIPGQGLLSSRVAVVIEGEARKPTFYAPFDEEAEQFLEFRPYPEGSKPTTSGQTAGLEEVRATNQGRMDVLTFAQQATATSVRVVIGSSAFDEVPDLRQAVEVFGRAGLEERFILLPEESLPEAELTERLIDRAAEAFAVPNLSLVAYAGLEDRSMRRFEGMARMAGVPFQRRQPFALRPLVRQILLDLGVPEATATDEAAGRLLWFAGLEELA